MKTLLIVLIFSSLFISIISPLFAISNSTDTLREAKFALPPKDTTEYNYYVLGGLGITTGSLWGIWSDDFHTGLAGKLGIELPFTNKSNFSVEFESNLWIAKLKQNIAHIDGNYIKLNSTTYTNFIISSNLKFYIPKRNLPLNASIHVGFVIITKDFICPIALDYGVEINYSLRNNWIISIENNFFLNAVGLASGDGSDISPSVLVITSRFKF